MSTNETNDNNNNGDLEERFPSETTSLLQQPITTSAVSSIDSNGIIVASDTSTTVNPNGNQQQQQQQDDGVLWDEMDKPWPSTYERAISLLSSPVLQIQQFDIITKSPKPGSSMTALARRRHLERGFYTPETGPMSVSRRLMEQLVINETNINYDVDDDDDDNNNTNGNDNTNNNNSQSWRSGGSISGSRNRSNSLAQLKSMDFFKRHSASNQQQQQQQKNTTLYGGMTTTSTPSFEQLQQQQVKKANEAKEYREQILKNANNSNYKTSTKGSKLTKSMKGSSSSKSSTHGGTTTTTTTGSNNGHGSGSGIIRETSFIQCVFNLANILMGMGLLGLPYAYSAAGWVGGGLSLFVFGGITWWTSILIGRELNGDPRPASYFIDSPFKTPIIPGGTNPMARMLPPVSSFPDIARKSFGETGALVLSIVLYFELFSCICIFLVSIGDHLHELIPRYTMSQHVVFATIVSLIPTVLLHTPKLLSYFSMLGTCATVVVVLAVICSATIEGDISDEVAESNSLLSIQNIHSTRQLLTRGDNDDDNYSSSNTSDNEDEYHVLWRSQGLITALGIISYCFSGHAIVPSIYSSMEQPQQFERMVTFTFGIVIVACFAVATSGYYMFGNTVDDQVTLSLKQYSKATYIMNALTGLMVLTALSKTTLTMFPLALGIEEIITPYLTNDKMVSICSVTIKITITILAAVVAIYCPSFSFLCVITGMVCTMSVSVIFPAAAHYKLFYTKLSLLSKISDILIIIAGCIMAIVGTYMTVKDFK